MEETNTDHVYETTMVDGVPVVKAHVVRKENGDLEVHVPTIHATAQAVELNKTKESEE